MIEDYRVYRLSKKQKWGFCIVCGGLLGISAYLYYNNLIISLIVSLLAYPLTRYYSGYLAEKRRKLLLTEFRDLLYSLSASFSAGRQMEEALKESVSTMDIIYGEDSLMKVELYHMSKSMDASGQSAEKLLHNFAQRTGLPDIISFSEIYGISKTTGFDLDRVIRKSIGILLDKMDLEREVHTLTAQKRMEFMILLSMPFISLIFLRVTSPMYMIVMYSTAIGRLIMTIALAFICLAGYLSNRITSIRL